MIYLLDTNAISDLMSGQSQIAASISRINSEDRLATSVISSAEIRFGIERLPHGQRRDALNIAALLTLGSLDIEPVPAEAAEHYVELRRAGELSGRAVGDNDLWIAAVAITIAAVRGASRGRRQFVLASFRSFFSVPSIESSADCNTLL